MMARTASEEDNKRIIMDLDVVLKSYDFPYIVRCVGYFIRVNFKETQSKKLIVWCPHSVWSIYLYGINVIMLR